MASGRWYGRGGSSGRNIVYREPPLIWKNDPAWPQIRRTILLLHLGTLVHLGLWLLWFVVTFVVFQIRLADMLDHVRLLLWGVALSFITPVALIADVVVTTGLRRRRPWALVGGLVLFAGHGMSLLFLPMTIIGISVLASAQVRSALAEPDLRG